MLASSRFMVCNNFNDTSNARSLIHHLQWKNFQTYLTTSFIVLFISLLVPTYLFSKFNQFGFYCLILFLTNCPSNSTTKSVGFYIGQRWVHWQMYREANSETEWFPARASSPSLVGHRERRWRSWRDVGLFWIVLGGCERWENKNYAKKKFFFEIIGNTLRRKKK